MRYLIILLLLTLTISVFAQHSITIDGNFDDWQNVTTVVTDPANDVHDTDWYGDGLSQPRPRKYSDVDILEVRFTHDQENLYGYVKASGIVGRTSRAADGQKAGRYYYIITIDVDNNDSTGYALQEGNYWPNSTGYDMNMEVEFYDGAFNTGHYINHEFLTEAALQAGRADLYNHIIRLAPGTYDNYLEWVVFPDSSIIEVADRGPVYQGIIEVAVSDDGHEAEMKAPMWGFFHDENGIPIVKLGNTIDISFSLEGSGELSESAIEAGYNGNRSVWGSDTAEPIIGYYLEDLWTDVYERQVATIDDFELSQNYPNPFNPTTTISYKIPINGLVTLDIFNAIGRRVRTLIAEDQRAGVHRVIWDGLNDNNEPVPSGIYMYRLTFGSSVKSQKMILIK